MWIDDGVGGGWLLLLLELAFAGWDRGLRVVVVVVVGVGECGFVVGVGVG